MVCLVGLTLKFHIPLLFIRPVLRRIAVYPVRREVSPANRQIQTLLFCKAAVPNPVVWYQAARVRV